MTGDLWGKLGWVRRTFPYGMLSTLVLALLAAAAGSGVVTNPYFRGFVVEDYVVHEQIGEKSTWEHLFPMFDELKKIEAGKLGSSVESLRLQRSEIVDFLEQEARSCYHAWQKANEDHLDTV